jgi:hypothetical protein
MRQIQPKLSAEPARSQIVMLGTGTPRPDPARSGPATAIVVNGTAYLIDFGPGVVRRAAAAFNKGITALGPAAARISLSGARSPLGWRLENYKNQIWFQGGSKKFSAWPWAGHQRAPSNVA